MIRPTISSPVPQVRIEVAQPQRLCQQARQARFLEHQRHLVNGLGGWKRDNGVPFHVAEQRNLVLDVLRHREVAAAHDAVRLNANTPKFLHAVLGWLRLQLAGRRDVGQQCDVDVVDVFPPHVVRHLPDRLQEGKALDVADRAADLDHHHVRVRFRRELHHLLLDHVGNVRNRLDGASQVLPKAFVGDDAAVHLSGGHAGGAGQLQIDEPLIVAQVHVRLRPIPSDKDLAVLVRGHGAGIDI